MDTDQLVRLAADAPAAAALAAYPIPGGETLLVASTGDDVIASVRVPREVANRLAAGMLPAATILGDAVEHDQV